MLTLSHGQALDLTTYKSCVMTKGSSITSFPEWGLALTSLFVLTGEFWCFHSWQLLQVC